MGNDRILTYGEEGPSEIGLEDRKIGRDLFQLGINPVEVVVSVTLDIDLVIGGLLGDILDLAFEEGSIELEEVCVIAESVGLGERLQGDGTRRHTRRIEGLHT